MNLRLSLVGSARPGSHLFGAEGGAFGRSQKCDWVLPDEERILSSVHGRLVFKNGEFMLVDESTNGIFVNGLPEPLGRGNSIVLSNGTRFSAGRYMIEVQLVAAERSEARPRAGATNAAQLPPAYRYDAQPMPGSGRNAEDALRDRSELGSLWAQNSQDPLSYMSDEVEAGIGGSLARQQMGVDPLGSPQQYGHQGYPPPLPTQRSDMRPGRAVFDDDPGAQDPLRALGHEQATPNNAAGLVNSPPYAHLPQQPAPPSRPLPPAQAPGTTIIPEDFLSSFGTPRKARVDQPASGFQQAAPARPATSQPLSQMPAQTSGPGALIPEGFDPFSMKPAQRAPDQRPSVGPRPAEPAGIPDEPRTTLGPGAQQPPKSTTDRSNGLSPALMADVVEFGSSKGGTLDTLEALKSRREQRRAAMLKKAQGEGAGPLPSAPPLPSPPPGATAAPAVPSAKQASAMDLPAPSGVTRGGGAADAALVRAFLEGMGFPDAEFAPGDYTNLLREAGETVRAMAAGLILLLSARKMVKSEFRMDETQVQPEENNPFKFFKVAELALDELFVTRGGGFQTPVEASKSAFEDLEQHTMLTMSAMQRAIKLIFERLSPNAMAGEAEDQGGLRIRGLSARKGKLETFLESHEKMSRNIDNVARQVIAEAFAQVQEEHARSRAKEYWGSKA